MTQPSKQTTKDMSESRSTERKGWLAFLAIVAMFGALTTALQFSSREKLHQLALNREASSYLTNLESYSLAVEDEFLEQDLVFVELGMEELVHDSRDYLEAIALRSLEIQETLGVFAFDRNQRLLEMATDSTHPPADADRLKSLDLLPFHPLLVGERHLSILYPMGEKGELGFLELLVEPQAILAQHGAIDEEIFQQGLWAFALGTILLFLIFRALLSRLLRSERELLRKSANLKEANLRLSQACKTAGVGAVTAHLMHALKSPLMGLKTLELDPGEGRESTEENLRATTRKIESLIEQTLNTLRECNLNEESYSFESQEVLSLAAGKFNEGENLRVSVLEGPASTFKIDNLKANLILPILHNLIQNSIESGPEVKVFLQAESRGDSLFLSVRDNGPGISPQAEGNLFKPMQSQKENGTGIGLAICKELADRAKAAIELEKSTKKGTSFRIEIPVENGN